MKITIYILPLLLTSCTVSCGQNQNTDYDFSSRLAEQVIYRFDNHRYLILSGEKNKYDNVDYCSGQIWYTDTQKNIFSRVGDGKNGEWVSDTKGHSAQFTVTPGDYIVMPGNIQYLNDTHQYIVIPMAGGMPIKKMQDGRVAYALSEVMYSADYGSTWHSLTLPFGIDTHLREENYSITVKDGQLFIGLKDGFYLSQKPLQNDFLYYYDYRSKDNSPDLPKTIPTVKNPQAWEHMQCATEARLTKTEKARFLSDKQQAWEHWGQGD